MKTARNAAIAILVLALAVPLCGQNTQVKFRGTVTVDEAHDVLTVCYGDYHATVAIEEILEDPDMALKGMDSVQVCYETALHLTTGTPVEVNGYYWGGVCPRQYCGRVQILDESDYIRRVETYGDNDWMVSGDTMHSIPTGNVGIGTAAPREKLHVAGNVLVEGTSPAWLKLIAGFGDDAGIGLTTTGLGVSTWEILREGASGDLRIRELFPYPAFLAERIAVRAGTGDVGIGTAEPDARVHVLGDVLIEGQMGEGFGAPLRVIKEGAGRQLLAYFANPTDGAVEVDIQIAGGKMLPWGWSMKAASGMFSLGSVMVFPPALNVKSIGYLGLGDTDPSYRLELPNTANAGGQARANAWRTYSSARWKTNVRTIDHAMEKVGQLRGVYFDWKEQGTRDMGMIAEEVGQVIPEVVDYEANGTDASALTYDRLVALLVEALKEQQARIAELEQAVADSKRLEQRLDALERLVQHNSLY